MKKFAILAATLGTCAALLAPPASASPPYTWGQEVKACNASSCYPDGTTRGVYVRARAQDWSTPGYAWEIQALALSPRGLGNGGF